MYFLSFFIPTFVDHHSIISALEQANTSTAASFYHHQEIQKK